MKKIAFDECIFWSKLYYEVKYFDCLQPNLFLTDPYITENQRSFVKSIKYVVICT